LFSEVQLNKIDVYYEECDRELSIQTQPTIVNKAKTMTTAALLTEKLKQFYHMRNAICLWNGERKMEL
jgi:hypothetical protein